MRAQRQDGFSLIEMLAALAILALAGIALMNALSTSARSATLAREMTLAQIAAQNLLSEALLNAGPGAMRDQRGEYALGGQSFDWALEVDDAGQPDLLRLRLVISEADADTVLYTLETLRRTS
ncbi:MAG: type II secretion system protein GspI [Oceanicaulis sp.]|jgi:general secretion pathway protein I|uniref:type II secretion system minor pseudopilin GspI n=1 Tax=unclassified Oceanicaulis TaxID=2632123 RepID=UPI000C3F4BBC|nr:MULTISPECIES: type II secretion system minor pseudopilin GspI [unclassified Oceanicaulis]MAB68206.1 type II secretion system protein GspI [Oceanicaulis sp.]MBC37890.1 type II secretion system protein GspI [Oceanicaulis sp.]MBG34648.1 type II secretion system protein GspI [Oceanicaulis sp.]HBU61412.1 type II secretion system protein GspI [Oceanicaulis sp.]HCR95711.1 type II secretion system protein GspI [Oceanicaulis sp.]|tara:strand:+ start:449 stop:817 length:369 start_codon:yes stop_codon:yes gene_type:complete